MSITERRPFFTICREFKEALKHFDPTNKETLDKIYGIYKELNKSYLSNDDYKPSVNDLPKNERMFRTAFRYDFINDYDSTDEYTQYMNKVILYMACCGVHAKYYMFFVDLFIKFEKRYPNADFRKIFPIIFTNHMSTSKPNAFEYYLYNYDELKDKVANAKYFID